MPHTLDGIELADIRSEYAGTDGDIAELIMGEQIHVGGMHSSQDLAEHAGITPGTVGVDLCCYTGAGMRYLVRFRGVARMIGVDATPQVVERGQKRCAEEGFTNRIDFVLADACASGLSNESADFVWGEDAWCYVRDKPRLIREAARIARPGGVIAFTDWVEGGLPMRPHEAERLMRFMRFPSILDLANYQHLLENAGCRVETVHDTGRFAPYADLYRSMILMQLTYDAFRLAGFDEKRMQTLEREREFLRDLAHQGKLIQGLLVARKPG